MDELERNLKELDARVPWGPKAVELEKKATDIPKTFGCRRLACFETDEGVFNLVFP
jgi:hypothetical protein